MSSTEVDQPNLHIGRVAAEYGCESLDYPPEQVADEQLNARCEVNATHWIASAPSPHE